MRTPAAARRAVARARARNADGRDGVRPVGMFTGTPSTRFAAGDHIPGAVERVASFGLAIEHPRGWAGGVRVRHFGPAPLVEDGSVRSDGTTVVNLRAGYALACHDLSEGGLAVALAEMCFAGGLGAEIDLGAIDHDPFPEGYDRDTTLLFSESCTRFLVEVEPGRKFNFQTKLMGLPATPIGRFNRSGTLRVKGSDGRPWFEVPIEEARAAFHGSFRG